MSYFGFDYNKIYHLYDSGGLSYFNSLYFIVNDDGIYFQHYNFENEDNSKFKSNNIVDYKVYSGNFINGLFNYLNIYDKEIPAMERHYNFKNDVYKFIHSNQQSSIFITKSDLYDFVSKSVLNYRFHYTYLLEKALEENNLSEVYYLKNSIKYANVHVKTPNTSKDYGLKLTQKYRFLKSNNSYEHDLALKEEKRKEREEKERFIEERKDYMSSLSEEERKRVQARSIAIKSYRRNKSESLMRAHKLTPLGASIYKDNYVLECISIDGGFKLYYTCNNYYFGTVNSAKRMESIKACLECHYIYFKSKNIETKNLKCVEVSSSKKHRRSVEFVYKYI